MFIVVVAEMAAWYTT